MNMRCRHVPLLHLTRHTAGVVVAAMSFGLALLLDDVPTLWWRLPLPLVSKRGATLSAALAALAVLALVTSFIFLASLAFCCI